MGVKYEVADGAVIENLRERRVQMKDPKSSKLPNMAFRVVDGHKPLLSVSKMTEPGHKMVFSKEESYVELTGGERLPLQSRDRVLNLKYR